MLQLKPSPIELLSQDVLNVELNATAPKNEFGGSNLSVERQIFKINEQPGCWGLKMELRFGATNSENPPAYTGGIALIGHYRVHKDYQHDHERLIRITGASMLYGAAREVLSLLTARSINGMLTLPSVSFFEDAPKKKVAKKGTGKKSLAKLK